jgi:hypothetical protein
MSLIWERVNIDLWLLVFQCAVTLVQTGATGWWMSRPVFITEVNACRCGRASSNPKWSNPQRLGRLCLTVLLGTSSLSRKVGIEFLFFVQVEVV